MRDIRSCVSEYAVGVVSDKSCINIINSPDSSTPSILNSVTCYYKTLVSTQKQIPMITITWAKNTPSSDQSLTIIFGKEEEEEITTFKLNTNPRLFKKLKGTKSIQYCLTTKIDISWDLSSARYQTGPEPVSGYYILITIDSEPGLVLGDLTRRQPISKPGTKFSLVSRREHFSGGTAHYSTKTRFGDSGRAHDVSIRCSGEEEGGGVVKKNVGNWVLSVCIDKKMVVNVKRLKWNFRGNQTIFLDGLLLDLMWDLHAWFFRKRNGNDNGNGNGNGNGNAGVFMFRTRRSTGSDSSLWRLEEDDKTTSYKGQDCGVDFSLMIYASL
ncbi:hypothetical protein ABFS82_14G235300 [Erythranthe guttata]|uniref:DUF868 domain-containing protein n=1 Tax=Erythranthe guttata TaxID=4155 RepID=A0A022RAY8_ERYGU|nr:PREDICTED: uncharacterized protein LOC105958700 [Erythranthe guttata]EYU36095.1 hypothetical protein MIMGU_mgv1a020850mg [Erythranthe guttata]|eukprot:XP_012838162.1 PREDICTED: uncharacterized protein LOC105958700 [Erythranthe guttata]